MVFHQWLRRSLVSARHCRRCRSESSVREASAALAADEIVVASYNLT